MFSRTRKILQFSEIIPRFQTTNVLIESNLNYTNWTTPRNKVTLAFALPQPK